jgi:arginase family enzyme
MTPRQLAAAARLCGAHPAVTAADFVEVDPAADRDDLTLMSLATTFLAFASGVGAREVAS